MPQVIYDAGAPVVPVIEGFLKGKVGSGKAVRDLQKAYDAINEISPDDLKPAERNSRTIILDDLSVLVTLLTKENTEWMTNEGAYNTEIEKGLKKLKKDLGM